MGPTALAQVLRPLATLFPSARHPDLLVGLEGPDDAAVYRLADDDALVVTVDFFPPVVDDPFDFGAIAAANAMSDVFAMGGEVLLALNVAVFPDVLPLDVATAIIRGGAKKVAEAGGVLAGGHTVTGVEPMYGLAVVGRLDPASLLRKSGAHPGDRLVLTKPLGVGLLTTALKAGVAEAAHVAAATASMATLNRVAARAAIAAGSRAATDVTGFGLIGHAAEMAEAGGVALWFDVGALPLLPGTIGYAEAHCVPGGTDRNRAGFAPRVSGLDGIGGVWSDVLFDPQTSGGLLIAIAPDGVDDLLARLDADGVVGRVVGGVAPGQGVVVRR
jgi:selenide, water dikinase